MKPKYQIFIYEFLYNFLCAGWLNSISEKDILKLIPIDAALAILSFSALARLVENLSDKKLMWYFVSGSVIGNVAAVLILKLFKI